MKVLSIIGAAVMGLVLVVSSSSAGPEPRPKPVTTQKPKRTRPKVLKDIPQAVVDAGHLARARRGRGEYLPEPKLKGRSDARRVTILLPGKKRPEATASRADIVPIQSASGHRYAFTPEGARANTSGKAPVVPSRLRYNAKGRRIGSGTSSKNRKKED